MQHKQKKRNTLKKIIILLNILFFINYYNISSYQEEEYNYYNETFFADSTLTIEELHNKLEQTISSKNLKNYGIAIYSLDKNHYYFSKNIESPLTPASLTKLVTTYNTIKLLGKDYNYSTEIYYDGKIFSDTLQGNLIIKGAGDPLFTTSDIEVLVDKVKKYGINYINGDIIADGRIFDNIKHRIDYSGDEDVVEPTPPITGLSVDNNTVTVLVTAGAGTNEKPRVQVFPKSPYFNIINDCKIISPRTKHKKNVRSKRNKSRTENLKKLNYYGDQLSTQNIIKDPIITTSNKLTNFQNIYVRGTITKNTTKSFQYHINNPNLAFAGVVYELLKSAKISINGNYREVEPNELILYPNLIFVGDLKRSIWDVINLVNKNSNNYLAENLYKLYSNQMQKNLNIKFNQIKDSISKNLFIKCENCKINDGSGLSRRNLVTPSMLINLLINSYNSEFKDNFINSLSIAGVDGTLRNRMKNQFTFNNVYAKTGTLRNVSGLAGYLNSLDGEKLAFVFIFNGNDVGYFKSLENKLCEILCSINFKK